MSRTEIQYTAVRVLPNRNDLDECSVFRGLDAENKEVEPTVWVARVGWKWRDREGNPVPILGQASATLTLPMQQEERPTDEEVLITLHKALTDEGWKRKPFKKTKSIRPPKKKPASKSNKPSKRKK